MDNYSLSVGVIVIKDSKVLLVKHNYGSANGKYLNPGGFLKDGELPEEAAVREIFEETGVKISPVGMIAVRCRSNEWYMVFKADYVEGEPCANTEENEMYYGNEMNYSSFEEFSKAVDKYTTMLEYRLKQNGCLLFYTG